MTPFMVVCHGSPRKRIQILAPGNECCCNKISENVEVALELRNGKRLEEREALDGKA